MNGPNNNNYEHDENKKRVTRILIYAPFSWFSHVTKEDTVVDVNGDCCGGVPLCMNEPRESSAKKKRVVLNSIVASYTMSEWRRKKNTRSKIIATSCLPRNLYLIKCT